MGRQPVFCWVDVIFRFVGRPGPFLAPFGEVRGRFFDFLVDFGVDWLPFLTPSTSKIVKIQLVFVCFLDLGCFQDKLQNQKNTQKPKEYRDIFTRLR